MTAHPSTPRHSGNGSRWAVVLLATLALGCSGEEQSPAPVTSTQTQAAVTPTPEPTPTPRPPETLELEGGVIVDVTQWGSGPAPNPSDSVRLHYVLTNEEGEELDTTREDEHLFEVSLDDTATLPGLAASLKHLPAGSIAKVTLPPGSAFADMGYADFMPPGATLILDLGVVEIVPSPPP